MYATSGDKMVAIKINTPALGDTIAAMHMNMLNKTLNYGTLNLRRVDFLQGMTI